MTFLEVLLSTYLPGRRRDERGYGLIESLVGVAVAIFLVFLIYKLVMAIIADT